MDIFLEIVQTFSASVPNASLLMLFPVVAVFMGGVSVGVTAIGETLDVHDEELRRKQRARELLVAQQMREEEMEAGNHKMIEQGR